MIHQELVSNARPRLTSSYIIYGLGGVSKTQLAIEYSYRHYNDFDIIYWLRADDYKTLLKSYSQFYEDLAFQGLSNLNLGDENNLENISAQVILWFENYLNIKWLLLINNAAILQIDSISEGQPIETIGNVKGEDETKGAKDGTRLLDAR